MLTHLKRRRRRLDILQGIVLLLAAAVVMSFALSLFSIAETDAGPATAEVLAHDSSTSHGFAVYLCVDPSEQWIDGTVVVLRSSQYLNMVLPATPEPTTSLGFLDYASATALLSPAAQHRLRLPPPGCLDDPEVRRRAYESISYAQFFEQQNGVVFEKPSNFTGNPAPPKAVIAAESAGFPTVVTPSSSSTNPAAPLSFRWHGVGSRGCCEHFLRLDFDDPKVGSAYGDIEFPTDIWTYLPSTMVPINAPTAAVYSSGHNGIHIIDVHMQPDTAAVEIDWTDESAASERDVLVLLIGIGLGAIGGVGGSLIFTSPRWDGWLLRRWDDGVHWWRARRQPNQTKKS